LVATVATVATDFEMLIERPRESAGLPGAREP
jgi:hypothetical protein